MLYIKNFSFFQALSSNEWGTNWNQHREAEVQISSGENFFLNRKRSVKGSQFLKIAILLLYGCTI